jgi:hypothetical protein
MGRITSREVFSAGFTVDWDPGPGTLIAEYQVVSSIGTYHGGGTYSQSAVWTANIATFKGPSAAAASSPVVVIMQ